MNFIKLLRVSVIHAHISQTSSFWVEVWPVCIIEAILWSLIKQLFLYAHSTVTCITTQCMIIKELVTHKFNKWCLYQMKTTKVYNNTSIKEVNSGQWRHFHKLFLPPPLPLGVAGVGLEWGVGPIWFVVTEVAANKSHCCVYHSKICHMLYVRLHQETNLKLYITIWVIALTT